MLVYIIKSGIQGGPYELEQINAMISDGLLSLTDLGWIDGWAEWHPLENVPGIIKDSSTSVGGNKSEIDPHPVRSNQKNVLVIFFGSILVIILFPLLHTAYNNYLIKQSNRLEKEKIEKLESESIVFHVQVTQVIDDGYLVDRISKEDIEFRNVKEKKHAGMSTMELAACDTSKRTGPANSFLVKELINALRNQERFATDYESRLKYKNQADHLEDLHFQSLKEDEYYKALGITKIEDRDSDIVFIQGALNLTTNQDCDIKAYYGGEYSFTNKNNNVRTVEKWIVPKSSITNN